MRGACEDALDEDGDVVVAQQPLFGRRWRDGWRPVAPGGRLPAAPSGRARVPAGELQRRTGAWSASPIMCLASASSGTGAAQGREPGRACGSGGSTHEQGPAARNDLHGGPGQQRVGLHLREDGREPAPAAGPPHRHHQAGAEAAGRAPCGIALLPPAAAAGVRTGCRCVPEMPGALQQAHRRCAAVPGPSSQAIYDYFNQRYPGQFKTFDDLFPVVTTVANFDEVRGASRQGSRIRPPPQPQAPAAAAPHALTFGRGHCCRCWCPPTTSAARPTTRTTSPRTRCCGATPRRTR